MVDVRVVDELVLEQHQARAREVRGDLQQRELRRPLADVLGQDRDARAVEDGDALADLVRSRIRAEQPAALLGDRERVTNRFVGVVAQDFVADLQ